MFALTSIYHLQFSEHPILEKISEISPKFYILKNHLRKNLKLKKFFFILERLISIRIVIL